MASSLKLQHITISVIFFFSLNFKFSYSQPCHSNCNTCSIAGDPNACYTCASSSALQVASLPGSCSPKAGTTYSIFGTIDSSTIDGTFASAINSITYLGINQNSPYYSSVFNSGTEIEFDEQSGPDNNTITFFLQNLGTDPYGIIISVAISDNNPSGNLQIIVDGTSILFPIVNHYVVYAVPEQTHTIDTVTIDIVMAPSASEISYIHDLTLILHKCENPCLTCFGAGINSCYSCRNDGTNDFFLQPSSTSCKSTCPAGYYANISLFTCQSCDANCKQCIGMSSNCTKCGVMGVMILYLENHICVVQCQKGSFKNLNYECQYCTVGCAECYGSGLTKCNNAIMTRSIQNIILK